MNLNLNIENINYAKIVYKDKNDSIRCMKAAVRRIDEREIVACAKFDENIFIDTPQEIKLSIACDNGLYKASTTLKYVVKEEPYFLFTIAAPDNIEYQQKREYFRVKINESALISYKSENDDKIDLPCETYDLSANGVRLILENKMSFPEIVKITLYLPRKIIETDAKYIRTDEEDNILKASFRFIKLQDTDIDCISQICFQKQLETRRKAIL